MPMGQVGTSDVLMRSAAPVLRRRCIYKNRDIVPAKKVVGQTGLEPVTPYM